MKSKDIRNDVCKFPLTFDIAENVNLVDATITETQFDLLRFFCAIDAHDIQLHIDDAINLIVTDTKIPIDDGIKTMLSYLFALSNILRKLGFESQRTREKAIKEINGIAV